MDPVTWYSRRRVAPAAAQPAASEAAEPASRRPSPPYGPALARGEAAAARLEPPQSPRTAAPIDWLPNMRRQAAGGALPGDTEATPAAAGNDVGSDAQRAGEALLETLTAQHAEKLARGDVSAGDYSGFCAAAMRQHARQLAAAAEQNSQVRLQLPAARSQALWLLRQHCLARGWPPPSRNLCWSYGVMDRAVYAP